MGILQFAKKSTVNLDNIFSGSVLLGFKYFLEKKINGELRAIESTISRKRTTHLYRFTTKKAKPIDILVISACTDQVITIPEMSLCFGDPQTWEENSKYFRSLKIFLASPPAGYHG